MSAADDAAKTNSKPDSVTIETVKDASHEQSPVTPHPPHHANDDDHNRRIESDEEDEEEEEEEEEEPKLKYDKLTSRLASLYRNGDSSSAFAVAGNKMVVGTHNGNIHVLALPAVQPLRTYQAHSASVTSCSVSPTPPPPTLVQRTDGSGNTPLSFSARSTATAKPSIASPKGARAAAQPAIPNTPDNAIFIATSSLDGHVCVFSLLDPKDVQLRNFARPVNTVALSPEYRSDRMYLSGGRAGQLILTKGGKAGVSSDANTNSAAAAASGWLGSIGLGSNTGRDDILHQGEGNISTIKWSLSGKWVAWVNEEGVKIMRSHLRLGSENNEDAWRRISHAAKPNRRIWEEMAGVWKARAHWVDDHGLEADEPGVLGAETKDGSTPKKHLRKSTEKLIVGWGDTAWVLHIQEGGSATSGPHAGKPPIGSADIIHKLQFRDCVVSGLCLYSPSLLAILAYRTRDDNNRKVVAANDKPTDGARRGRSHKHTGLAPQLRLVNVHDGEELDVDELPMSRFETFSAQDYDFESLWIPPVISEKTARDSKGALEGLWEASGGYYAQKMLSSGASVLSKSSSGPDDDARRGSANIGGNTAYDVTPTQTRDRSANEHQYLLEPGLKLFISSPYDCIIGVRRQPADHLEWLMQHEKYAQAWALIDKQPAIVEASNIDQHSIGSGRQGQARGQQTLADFLGPEDSASMKSQREESSSAAYEKLRVGELWLNQLITVDKWPEAGHIAGKVLQDSGRWEHWILSFAHAKHVDDITPFVPGRIVHPSIPSIAYEVILGHYIVASPSRLLELVDSWEEGLFDASAIVSAIRARLASNEIEDGSDDWRALTEALGQLYLSLANPQEALKCFIRTQSAEKAFVLIQEERIADALSDNVTGFVTMRISADQLRKGSLSDLDAASKQSMQILVKEARKNTVRPETVIRQLQKRGRTYRPFLYLYLRALWYGMDDDGPTTISHRMFDNTLNENHAMVEDFADLAVETFADYDRDILMEFLEASEVYDYNRAVAICDEKKYIPELVLVLSRTGQTKRALWLIIGELGDATKAIAFVKQYPDLWDDLLEYGMDKPKFVRGLLAEVGTSIDPVKIVRQIPTGLEIEGLKEGILNLVQSWEVQLEVSRGVERVLRGEVLGGMEKLRQGQRQGVRFEVMHDTHNDVEVSVVPPPLVDAPTAQDEQDQLSKPGCCVGCEEIFHEDETQPLLGFACGHVYHLSCLLEANPKSSDGKAFDNLMSSLGYDDDDDGDAEAAAYSSRSVGAKVTHAHLIRNAVKDGCQHCSIWE